MIEVRRLAGTQVGEFLPDLARLRMQVFRTWPYLYDGDAEYEQRYLATYARSERSVFVLALEGERVVGVATGLPLGDEDVAFHAPFRQRGIAVHEVFYFGESVLLPAYRGQGIGHRFFDEREAHAASFDAFCLTAFAAVDRSLPDPRRPPGHRDNDPFWRKRGYARQDDMRMQLAWREIDQAGETSHSMTFWLRNAPGSGDVAT